MDLLGLRYFQAAARHEHISRAADDLGVPQPSISRAVARLERELGVPLFHRDGRHIRINRFGTAFLDHVDRTLQELDDARRELVDATVPHRGSVTVAAETLLTLAHAARTFRIANPDITMRLTQLDAEQMAEQLRLGDVELCLASQPVGGPPLVSREVLQEEVFLVVPADHRLADRHTVTIPELADEPMVVMRKGFWQRELTDALFRRAGLHPRIVCEGNEPGATQDLVEAGLGISFLPAMARPERARPTSWLHLDAPGCRRTLSLVWNKNAYMPAAAVIFREFVGLHFGNART